VDNTGKEEDKLVEQFKAGDRSAFDKLYDRYKNRIFNFVLRKIGDRTLAEELTQEVFIRIYMNIDHYQARGLFRSWAYTIASNLVKNKLIRKSYREVSLSMPIGKMEGKCELADILASSQFSPEVLLEKKELKEGIKNTLNSLPPAYKEVIVLCVIEGLSYKESARILHTTVKNISSRLTRGRVMFIRAIEAITGSDEK